MVDQKKQTPHFKRQTPANQPELLQKWKNMYNDLVYNQGYKKSAALEQIGIQHNVTRMCICYWLFPAIKKRQQKRVTNKWAYEKADSEIHTKRVGYKKNYMRLRRHIDEYLETAYQCTPLSGSLSLDEISHNIDAHAEIALSPQTILGLNTKYEAKHGQPLISEVFDSEKYRLNL